jgi:penicillin amidase
MRALHARWRQAASTLSCALAVGALSQACDSDPEVDAGLDASADTTTPEDGGGGGLDDLPVSETLDLPGLEGPVEVFYDDRGIPHIYGSTVHDVILAEGFLMSRDRFGQMEFIRRNVLGRLSEVAESLSPGLSNDDFDARVTGYGRMGRLIWEDLQDSTDPVEVRTRETAQAFVDGINAYMARVRAGQENPAFEGAEALNLIVFSPYFTDWEPSDVFAMARFQAMSLSFDAGADIGRTQVLAGIAEAFGDPGDPRRAIFHDLYGDLPARAVYTRDGFNDGTTEALLPDFRPHGPAAPMLLPSRSALDAAAGFFERFERRTVALGMGDEHRGSNNWLVAGSLTESGNPILSNDPHLSLISPPVWWYVHLNTERMGGEDAIDAEGVAFAGLPGVVLGFNRNIAWGATTTGYDVTDVYLEQITEVADGPDTVLFDEDGDGDLSDAVQVALVSETETINVAGADPIVRDIEYVPHHGPILPGTREPVVGMPGRFTALSVRYTGYDVSNELAYFTALLTATNTAEAATAQNYFRVGSQNFIVIDREHIRWSTESRIPVRDPRALTFDYDANGVHSGSCPLFVLDGTGAHEWMSDLPSSVIPHDEDPARGYIATANQDNVGVTGDGNACNDAHYIGGDFDFGWRQDHIVGELERLSERGDITVEDMQALQALTTSSTGTALRDRIVEILGDTAAITAAGIEPADVPRLAAARTRLMAWSLETPHGVGATDATVIADSVATAIFNAALTHILPLALNDEGAAIGRGPGSDDAVRWLEQALVDPTGIHSALNGDGRSVLFDDLTTTGETETEETIVLRGTLLGLNFLTTALGADLNEWRWGRMHRVRFSTVVPAAGTDIMSIPPVDDPMFPGGFPRHGDWGAVDVGNFGMFAGSGGATLNRYMHGSGASMRFVVEMTATGPLAYNAIPGGQVYDPASPHHRDEAALWIANEAPRVAFDEADIVSSFERRISLTVP